MNEVFLEAVGPIVVKEVRQGLRAKVFAICFGLLLFACLVTALFAAAEVRDSHGVALGPQYLTLFLSGVGIICFFVIPYTAYRSMAREREEETWVLLALTGLSSRRIVHGKTASALTQAVLYASAGAPFMVFSYFLNGVDLPTLLLELFLAACMAVFLTSCAVALGTEGHTRQGRAAVHFFVLGLLGAATFAALAFGANMARKGGAWLDEATFLVFSICFPLLLLSTSALVLEGAAAGLCLASDASARGARLVLLGQLVVVVSATFLGVALMPSTANDLAAAFSVMTSLFLAGFGFFAISERDGHPRSQPRPGWLTGGALRGWKLVTLALVGTTVAWAALHLLKFDSANPKHWSVLLAAPLYVGLYLSLAVLAGRLTPLRRLGEPVATRLAFVILVAAAAVLSPVVAMLAGERNNDRLFNALNPIIGMVNMTERFERRYAAPILVLLFGLWAFCSLVAWAVLKRRDGSRLG